MFDRPVEVRITGADLVDLRRAADLVVAEFSAVEGAADVRDDLSLGVPTVAFEIDDAAAARRGLARARRRACAARPHARARGRTVPDQQQAARDLACSRSKVHAQRERSAFVERIVAEPRLYQRTEGRFVRACGRRCVVTHLLEAHRRALGSRRLAVHLEHAENEERGCPHARDGNARATF